MFITELFESNNRNLVVVYAGRFQPFHKGHKAVYDYLLKHYGRDSVYIATSNKIDPPKSPFGFTDKTYFMQMMGIPMDRVIESSQPYKATELTSNYDPENTVFLIAVSQKDMAEDPRFKVGYKKDGNPSYFQNLPTDLKTAAPMSQHGYLVVVPTFDFKVLGQPMRSATEIRAAYGKADEATRREIIQDLFGAYTQEAQHIMDSKLVSNSIDESFDISKLLTMKKPTWRDELVNPESQFMYQGFRIVFTPTALKIYNGGDLVYEKSGDYSKPTKQTYNAAKGFITGHLVSKYKMSEGEVVPMTRSAVPPEYELALKLSRRFLSFDESAPDAHQQMEAILAKLNSMGYSLQSTLNPKHDGLDLVHKPSSFRQYIPYKMNESASGYIPKNKKEAKDPRWERALSVDVRPDTMKKELAAFFPTKAPKTQQHQVTESMYFQGYQVDLDQVSKQLILSKNGTELYRGNIPNAGRPLGPEAVKKRVSAIIDQLEDDKYPDDLEMREAREPYQQAIDRLEWAMVDKKREDIDFYKKTIEEVRRGPGKKSEKEKLIQAYTRKIESLHNDIKDILGFK